MSPRAHLEVNIEDGWLQAFGRTTDSSVLTSHDVAAGLGWPVELEQRCPDWAEAFRGWPLRNTLGQPSRLIHIQSSNEMCPERYIQYAVVRPEQPVQYAAVSYVWAQWEKIEDMLSRLQDLMAPIGLKYCWIDQLCIDQESDDDKKAEIKRMRAYYAQAAITYVMVPDWSATFTWELDGFSMSYEQAARAGIEIRALETTLWASRVWTMQEASLSGRTVYVGRSVLKSAAELAVARGLDWVNRERGHWLVDNSDGLVHAVWRRNLDGSTHVRMERETARRAILTVGATHLLRDRIILTRTNHAKTDYDYLDDVWRISGARQCTQEEDRVYGMLGLVRRGDTVAIEYGIGFEEAVRRAAAKGLVSSGILLTETSSHKPGRSWCPAPGTEDRFSEGRSWDESHKFTQMQPIQLTPEGLCFVQAARFQMPAKPKIPTTNKSSILLCKNREGGGKLLLKFNCGIPEGEEWQGDWLVVVEIKDRRRASRATLIKYETIEGERLHKVQALEAEISLPNNEYVGQFLLG